MVNGDADRTLPLRQSREIDGPRWRIGEMASFFGISIQTLRYYDKLDLFSPDYRDPFTGYRYYSRHQIYLLANIVFLRKQGYALEEIKRYVLQASTSERIRNLLEQAVHLEREAIRLRSSSGALRERIQYIAKSDYAEQLDTVELVDLPARDYVEIGHERHLFPSELFYFFPTIIHYAKENVEFGVYINNKPLFLTFISLEPSADEIVDQIRTTPAGKAYRGFYQGPYERIDRKVDEMREIAREAGHSVSPVSIHYNIIDSFVAMDADDYITEIHMPLTGQADESP